ncbi:MAG: TRAP transporter fused permease subunit [Planctomycetes bacterium]|nr:TRAP transporter fused permease subunit [Planctomycetota bacterium]
MLERIHQVLVPVLGVFLCLFTLKEANYPQLQETSQRAVFVMLGLVICFLSYPWHKRYKENRTLQIVDLMLAGGVIVCCGYVIVQTEPLFEALWLGGSSLGNRAGSIEQTDFVIGLIGVLLVLEGTRRSIGWAVPALAISAIAYAYFRDTLPDWLMPHRSQSLEAIVSSTFLKGQGVFGKASAVMFKYVFLFVIFGAFLEVTGATQFIIDFSERLFGRSPGGPAKVSVLGSGLMGSLSGSAVANAVTTGTFTIPMMRNAGFQAHIAGGITAAAASGGALVPPVMGAGAYMMLEFIEGITFLEIAQAAIIPAILYYFSIFLIVHFFARRVGNVATKEAPKQSIVKILMTFEGVVFFGALTTLITFLSLGNTPFRAVTISLAVIIFLGLIHPRKKISVKTTIDALVKSAKNGVSLVSASACVGIVIGIVDLTRVSDRFGEKIKGLVETNLLLALVGVMVVSIILGMGVPSVVCYLLMATMMGSLLTQLQVPELAAHLFIFYFGMMSMVTPPVALAAYASASIAKAKIMSTAFAAFRFSLVGFTLPFMFIYRPELLLMFDKENSWVQNTGSAILSVGAAALGIVALAAGLTGYLKSSLAVAARCMLLVTAALLLAPNYVTNGIGVVLLAIVAVMNWRSRGSSSDPQEPTAQGAL